MRKYFAALGAAVLLGIMAAPALAHMTIQPGEGPAGAFFKFAVRVPNESGVANTKVTLTFPENVVFASFMPKEGWNRKVTMKKLDEPIEVFGASIDTVVDTVTWSGGSIGVGEFEEFEFSVKLPDDETTLVFSASQTYADGEVVVWDGDEESEHPSPVASTVILPAEGDEGPAPLSILKEASEGLEALDGQIGHLDGQIKDLEAQMAEMSPMPGHEDSDGADTGVLLGAIGIGLGAVALIIALMKGRSTKS